MGFFGGILCAPFLMAAFTTAAFAQDSLVYMLETDGGKQIVLANGDGKYPTAITDGTNWHLYPDIDASGNFITYLEGKDGKDLNVVVYDRQKQLLEQWTKGEAARFHPRFSRDGRFLAFTAPDSKGKMAIHVLSIEEGRKKGPFKIELQGTPVRIEYEVEAKVIESQYPCYFPALSSDGSFVVFQRNISDTVKDIALYDFSTGKTTALTAQDAKRMSPALSIDDRQIAFTQEIEKNWEVFVMDRLTGKTVQVTNHEKADQSPAFRADGSLIFASNRMGNYSIFEVTAAEMEKETFTPKLLATGAGDRYAARLSGNTRFRQQTLPEMPAPARSSFGAARVGDKIYLMGGHQGKEHTYPPESFLDRVDIYNVKTGEWTEGAPRPTRCHGYQTIAYGKYIYAFGGFAYSADDKPKWKSLSVIDKYDTQTNTWEQLRTTLLEPRSSNVAALVNDKIYLMAGWDSRGKGKFHDTVEVFDPKSETISLAPYKLPNPLRRALSSITIGEEVLLIGGLGEGLDHFELMDRVTAVNVTTGKAREFPKLPFATFAPATAFFNRSLFVFGGMFKTGKLDYVYVNHVYEMKLSDMKWRHTGRHLQEAKGFSQVLPIDMYTVGVIGGHSYDQNTDAPVQTFETFGY